MTDSKIYLKAAAKICTEEKSFCCNAIAEAVPGSINLLGYHSGEQKRLIDHFASYFKPRRKKDEPLWWPVEDKESRTIALLLMSEIAKQ